jgi:hypothetical protein
VAAPCTQPAKGSAKNTLATYPGGYTACALLCLARIQCGANPCTGPAPKTTPKSRARCRWEPMAVTLVVLVWQHVPWARVAHQHCGAASSSLPLRRPVLTLPPSPLCVLRPASWARAVPLPSESNLWDCGHTAALQARTPATRRTILSDRA